MFTVVVNCYHTSVKILIVLYVATVSLLIKLDIKSVKSGIFDSFDSSRKRTNWLCQYKMIKQIFTKFEHKYDFSKIPYKQNKYQYLLISTTPRFLIKIYKT